MVKFESITVNEYGAYHNMFSLLYAFHPSPFGRCLIAITDRNNTVAYLGFVNNTDEDALKDLKNKWSFSEIMKDTKGATTEIVSDIFGYDAVLDAICVLLKGTEFEIKVWKSLLTIPKGTTVTYEEVARMNGNLNAVRVVASIIAKNRLAYIVPCHRVRGKNGSNKYAWGTERKQAIQNYEIKDN